MKTQWLFKVCHSKGVSHRHLSLAEPQRQAEDLEEMESFVGEEKEGCSRALTRGCWYREAVGRLTGSGASHVTSYGSTSGFSGWS